jgi:hypothetical protein
MVSIEYISAMNCICNTLFDRSMKSKDIKLRHISLMVYNYIVNMIKENNIDYKYTDGVTPTIDMVPIYDYIYQNQIVLYDLNSITVDDMDVNKKTDVERFILSHVNYIFNK